MPRTRSLAWAELKIGILTVFAVVMSALLVFAVGGSGGFFWQRYPLKVHFPNIATVKSGTPVRNRVRYTLRHHQPDHSGVQADSFITAAHHKQRHQPGRADGWRHRKLGTPRFAVCLAGFSLQEVGFHDADGGSCLARRRRVAAASVRP